MNRGLQGALLLSGVVTVLLWQVPYGDVIGRPLVWLSTLAHELGHGLTAVFAGGSFKRLVLHPDASGLAVTSCPPGWRDGVVAAGGLLGPPVIAAAAFLSARSTAASRTALAVAAGLLFVVAVLWAGNWFTRLFVLGLALGLGGVARWLDGEITRFVVTFLAVQLSLSVFSRSDYLFTEAAQTAEGVFPSDVAKMSAALSMPYWFWGAVCGVFSVVVLVGGLKLALTANPTPRRGRARLAA